MLTSVNRLHPHVPLLVLTVTPGDLNTSVHSVMAKPQDPMELCPARVSLLCPVSISLGPCYEANAGSSKFPRALPAAGVGLISSSS